MTSTELGEVSNVAIEDPDEKEFEKRMDLFHETFKLYSDNRKADLLAYKKMRAEGNIIKSEVGKHPRGVKPSTGFKLRAELAISGVHHELMRGISTNENTGVAESIVLSGYYAANEDRGDSFVYSGEGGLRNGVQVSDQVWCRGNLGLRQACQSETPIRVVRCIIDEWKSKTYYYEGLYKITRCWTETRDGFDICLFHGQGVEGQYSVSGTVGYNPNAFYRADEDKRIVKRERVQIAPTKKARIHRIYGHLKPIKAILEAENARIEKLKNRKDVLCLDISRGKEALIVPLINDIDDEGPPKDFRYVNSVDDISDAASILIESSKRHWCLSGCQKRTTNQHYNNGLLNKTFPEGIRECSASCIDCMKNRITSQGVRYPLEVFKTREKGWGVRSSVDIPTGAFVCEYIGRVVTDDEAEDVVDSSYLYSLDHFFLLQEQIISGELKDIDASSVPCLPLSDDLIRNKEYNGKYLVFDAKYVGNIGRFINHCCPDGANLVTMMVLREGCNGVFHRIAFFASEDIPRMTELCYDYGWNTHALHRMKCNCATKNCKGFIL
eukprot:g8108.t1